MEKKCRYCAMMIPKDAKICPHCRKTLGWTWPAKIVVGLIVLGAIGSLIGRGSEEPAQKAAKPAAQIIAVSAEQLYKEYEANEIAADQRYRDKTLRVTGTIRDLGKTIGDKPYINLATGTFSHQVMVMFPAGKYDAQLATYKKGGGVEVTGRCTGRTLGMVGIHLD